MGSYHTSYKCGHLKEGKFEKKIKERKFVNCWGSLTSKSNVLYSAFWTLCASITSNKIVAFKSVSSLFLVYLCLIYFYISEHSCFLLFFSVSSPLRAASPEWCSLLLSFISFDPPGQHSTDFLLILTYFAVSGLSHTLKFFVLSFGIFCCGMRA